MEPEKPIAFVMNRHSVFFVLLLTLLSSCNGSPFGYNGTGEFKADEEIHFEAELDRKVPVVLGAVSSSRGVRVALVDFTSLNGMQLKEKAIGLVDMVTEEEFIVTGSIKAPSLLGIEKDSIGEEILLEGELWQMSNKVRTPISLTLKRLKGN